MTDSSIGAHDLFEVLIREHAGALMAFLRASIRDSSLVDDIFQETCIVAWRNIAKFDRERPFGPWLRGIAGNLILEARRNSARNVASVDSRILDEMNSQLADWQHQPGNTFDEKLEALGQCLTSLVEPFDEVIQLRYRDQASLGRIAEKMGTSLEAAKKRLQRARAQLLACIQRKLAFAREK